MTWGKESLLIAWLALGCAAARPAEKHNVPTVPSPSPASDRAAPRKAPLTSGEAALKQELVRDVRHLVLEVGERHVEKQWELAGAADWIAGELESVGLAVQRLGAESSGDAVALDVEATRRGGDLGREAVVLIAHYDSHPGSTGADDNATGVAALLALGRRLRFLNPSRTLRVVATASADSSAYAERLRTGAEAVSAVLSLNGLGYYSDAPSSQRCPKGLPESCSPIGNFVALVGNDRSQLVLDLVTRTLGRRSDLTVRTFLLTAKQVPVLGDGPSAYEERGFPSVLVTDTGPLRHPGYHSAGDTLERVDFDQLARLVAGLEEVVKELGGRDDDLAPKGDYRPKVRDGA